MEIPEIPVVVTETIILNSPGYASLPVTVDLQQIFQPSSNFVFEWDPNFLNAHSVYGPGFVVKPEELTNIILTSLGPPVTPV